MSSNEELWDQVAKRVTKSQVGGVRADDDDVIAAAEIVEAAINPHRGAQGGMGGAGMPGMMPPMMMGGMGSGAGAGGAGGGGGGLGGARAAEAAQGPMSAPAPQPAAAGVPGDATPIQKAPDIGGGGGGGGGSLAGLGGGGGELSSLGGGGGGGLPGSLTDAGGGEPPVEQDSEVGGVSMVASEAIVMGKVEAQSAAREIDGFEANPAEVRMIGDRWTALAEFMGDLTNHPEADMGLFENAQRPQQALGQQLNEWRKGAVGEFEAMAERLHETAAGYETVDDEGVAEIRRAGAGSVTQ